MFDDAQKCCYSINIMKEEELLALVVGLRRKRLTYRAICEALETDHGIKKHPGNLHRWLKSQRRKAKKVAEELAPFERIVPDHISPSIQQGERKTPSWMKQKEKPQLDDADFEVPTVGGEFIKPKPQK